MALRHPNNWRPAPPRPHAATVTEDNTLTVAAPGVLGNDVDPDGDPLSPELVTDTVNGVLKLASDGSYTYRPLPDFSGTDSFTYRVDDGLTQSPPVTVTITVTPVNDPPAATADSSCAFGEGSCTYTRPLNTFNNRAPITPARANDLIVPLPGADGVRYARICRHTHETEPHANSSARLGACLST